MTDHIIRWEDRFTNFCKAQLQLKRFIEKGNSLNDLEAQGMIQAFEYTYEMAWKTMRDYMEEKGQLRIHGCRDAIRTAVRFRLIDNADLWMQMVDDRNETSHSYDEEVTDRITGVIHQDYYPLFLLFRQQMELIQFGHPPIILLNFHQ